MPNLVGIGLSQVPTNSMLGGMAYQDPDRVKIKKLNVDEISQINSEIADTAVDIFIYDTSKDSDGGAWRKRTTHTSWYNETLGTSTRGTRREFPAVAVIVAEVSKVTIYDGDDPDLPMWMVFDRTTSGTSAHNTNFLAVANINIANIFMLNGILCVAFANGGWGVSEIGFVSDSQKWWWTSGIYKQPANTIAERHVTVTYYAVDTSASVRLGNANIQDLAMAVQPNAKVDIATGLPIPTIALGTAAQANIIKHDGRVFELTGFSPTDTINIDESHVVSSTSSSGGNDFIFRTRIPSSDESFTAGIAFGTKNYYMNSSAGTTPLLRDINHTHIEYDSKNKTTYRGGNAGFDIIVPGEVITNSNSRVAVAYATTSFNTGYMIGDIKGAFLSDTDATNVSPSSNLVSNGDFADTNLSNYFTLVNSDANGGSEANSTPYVNGSNQLVMGNSAQLKTTYNLVAGRVYRISYDCVNKSISQQRLGIYVPSGGSLNFDDSISAGATNTYYYTATSTGSTLIEWRSRGGGWGTYDNFTIIESTELDRSVNNKGLEVYGTINKSAVATGADLVGYSPSSNTSYLEQPYNSDLNYGTGDMYYSVWVYASSSDSFSGNTYIFERSSISDNSQRRIEARMTSPTRVEVYSCDTTLDNNVPVPSDAWFKLDIVRRSGEAFVYINGEYHSSTTGSAATRSLTDTNAKLVIGNRAYFATRQYGFPSNSKIALFRTGATAPTAEQIKKIYEDERLLFQENAKCTLYGSSNTVTGLAFDESTDRLHVGTSSGRSDFQGLRRINNTTTAVTTAISAHDGFIVEQ
jgi:hypothetical protein